VNYKETQLNEIRKTMHEQNKKFDKEIEIKNTQNF